MKDRTPPKDVGAERCCLGAVFIEPDRLHSVLSVVDPGDFFDPTYRDVLRAMLELRADGKPIDLQTIKSIVQAKTDEGKALVAELAQAVPHTGHATAYAEIVKQKALKRRIIKLASDATELAYNGQATEEIVVGLQAELEDIARRNAGANPTLITMSEVEPQATTWLWDGWIPDGCLVLLDGGDRPVELPKDVPAIEQIIVENAIRLVVVDPLMSYPAGNVDTYKDHDVRRALHRLATVAERTDATVLLVRHLTKDTNRPAKYRGGGSIGIIGAARSAMLVGADPDDDSCRVLAMSKSNLAPRPVSLRYAIRSVGKTSRIEWLGETHATADELGQPKADRGPTKGERCGELLESLLAVGPRDTTEVLATCKAAGFSRRTVARARDELGVMAKKSGFDAGWQSHLGDYLEGTES